ncbi:MAG: alkylphosphonate utilization protein, partial [Bacteroidales bacterium]
MNTISNCPQCDMDNTYFDGVMNICPDCGYEWTGS